MDAKLNAQKGFEAVYARLQRLNRPTVQANFTEHLAESPFKPVFDQWLGGGQHSNPIGNERLGAPGSLGVTEAVRHFGASAREVVGAQEVPSQAQLLRVQLAAAMAIASDLASNLSSNGGMEMGVVRPLVAELAALLEPLRQSISLFTESQRGPGQLLRPLRGLEVELESILDGRPDSNTFILMMSQLNGLSRNIDSGSMELVLSAAKAAGGPVPERILNSYREIQDQMRTLRELIPQREWLISDADNVDFKMGFARLFTRDFRAKLDTAVAELRQALTNDPSRPWQEVLRTLERFEQSVQRMNEHGAQGAIGVLNIWSDQTASREALNRVPSNERVGNVLAQVITNSD